MKSPTPSPSSYFRVIKKIIITRPETDAKAFATALSTQNIEGIIEPLSHIEYEKAASLPPHFDAIVVTSRHALLSPLAQTLARNVPLFVVGESSAKLAYTLGFTDIHMAGENVEALATYIRRHCEEALPPKQSSLVTRKDSGLLRPESLAMTFLYLRGTHIHHDLAKLLPNFTIEERIVYTTHLMPELSPECVRALCERQLSGVAFFSTRHAEHFITLCNHHKLEPYSDLTAYCMSAAIAAPIKNHPWKNVVISPSQNAASMVEVIVST